MQALGLSDQVKNLLRTELALRQRQMSEAASTAASQMAAKGGTGSPAIQAAERVILADLDETRHWVVTRVLEIVPDRLPPGTSAPDITAAAADWFGWYVRAAGQLISGTAAQFRAPSWTNRLEVGGQADLLRQELDLRLAPRVHASEDQGADEGLERGSLISAERLGALRGVRSETFDLTRLVRIVEEIDRSYDAGCYHATAAMVRTLLNHVPPVFGHRTFEEVASNYGAGGKSFKEQMGHLQGSARRIADRYLHLPIRDLETLPTAAEVNFGPDIDSLLGEVIRILARGETPGTARPGT